jgi:hypothetical protein
VELDEQLNEFTNFISNSLSQNELRKRVVLQTNISKFNISKFKAEFDPGPTWLGRVNLPNMSIDLPKPLGIRLSYAEKKSKYELSDHAAHYRIGQVSSFAAR